MESRFLTPALITVRDATPAMGEQAAFINMLRDIDTALASAPGLHVADFASEHGISETEVLGNLKVLEELGYSHCRVSRS